MKSFLSYFRSQRRGTAAVAKERLQIIVARERAQRDGPDFLAALQEDIFEVVRKYVTVDRDAVRVDIDRDGDCEVLELNVTLPERPSERPTRSS